MENLEAAVKFMENLCNDNTHGYSMTNRWGPDYDCSSSVITALRSAGFDTGSANVTSDMSSALCGAGWVRLSLGIELKRGDLLLNDEHHVAMYVGDGQLAEFSSDYDGTTGDSSGREAYIHEYYDYPWDCVLRWPKGTIPAAEGYAEDGVWTGFFYDDNGIKIEVKRGFIVGMISE